MFVLAIEFAIMALLGEWGDRYKRKRWSSYPTPAVVFADPLPFITELVFEGVEVDEAISQIKQMFAEKEYVPPKDWSVYGDQYYFKSNLSL